MPLTHLGELPIEDFLRDYWQKKPLLIRDAFPNFESPLDGDELAGLALEEEIESRLVLEHGKTPWELRQGPFEEEAFGQLPESHWTLLVQAVDQWVPEVQELLSDFRFLPDWRLDDIMVSYATDQGSVGPHFDYYDVFLLQGAGKRRWRIGQHCDSRSPRVEGTPLNILKDFYPKEEWVLGPGDMLYIPPGIAHWGTAQGDDCITYSIGFRAPSVADIFTELSQDIASRLTNDQRYRDPAEPLGATPGEIPPQTLETLRSLVQEQLTDSALADWFGRYMTLPKYPELEPEEGEGGRWQDFEQLERHPTSRFAYTADASEARFYVDGEQYLCSLSLAQCLCEDSVQSVARLKTAVRDEQDHRLMAQLVENGKLWG
ncbi:cupin domain-containing protein [Marinimicrobium agarilyticum]|uniref:cupin domain-containing protein n=1 Tax=Marinimicrobium agarilyticum TaxID=306546 RepID=UPI00041A1584|nr:cupin domain-containing protein [Marinimicrobium agarilyticum]